MCNSMRPALWKSLWNIRFHPKVKWEYPQQCIKTCSIKGLQRLILFCQRRFQNASNDIPIPISHIQKPKLMDELQLAGLQHGTRRYGENFWLFLILKSLMLKTFWEFCTSQPYPSLKETNGHFTFCDYIWPADVSHGRPHHPDHRLHGQVVPGKDALLHCASLHGEIIMIMMVVVVVVMIDDDGDLVMMMTKYVTVYLQCLFAGSLCIHINIQHDCNCSGQVF